MIVPCGAAFLIDKGENIENKKRGSHVGIATVMSLFVDLCCQLKRDANMFHFPFSIFFFKINSQRKR